MLDLYRTEFHPEASDEGGIDPLGLASVAEKLGQMILPGLLERHKRPRFLTLSAIGLSLLDEVMNTLPEDDWKVDFWEAYEWLVVSALVSQNKDGVPNLPSSEKTRNAEKNVSQLNPERYLKTPSVFGFHGVYKFLAKDLMIEHGDCMAENGNQLFQIWANEQGLTGFIPGHKGPGLDERKRILKIVIDSMRAGYLTEKWRSSLFPFINQHFHHLEIGLKEKEYLKDLLNRSSNRNEVISFLKSKKGLVFLENPNTPERDFYTSLEEVLSNDAKEICQSILRFEALARSITDAFYDIQFALSQERFGLTDAQLATIGSIKLIHKEITKLIEHTEKAFSKFDNLDLNARLEPLQKFKHLNDPKNFVSCLIEHHIKNQKRKPPNGKNPWLYQNDRGAWIIRPGYFRDVGGSHNNSFVHFYRLGPLRLFLFDLGIYGKKK